MAEPSGETAKSLRLFAQKKNIYPAQVSGKYRRLRWLAMFVLLGIYYLAPFLRWDRGLHAPDQAILIDMPSRRAYFFFIEIWPQEVYFLVGILVLAAIGLFFVSSLLGRVWCGYACPQTVWTDMYIAVEHFFQGDHNARKKLDESPLGWQKIWRKTATHGLWLLIALFTGGAWVLYFNDAPTLIENITHLDVPRMVLGWIGGLTLSTYIMAGYAREQVCIYMCPYARFQSAMFDQDTLIIGYDVSRGEPRGKHKKGDSWEGKGHCIDCHRCVAVCPTGIDIREGLQMECIACGLCVDACNDVMDKVGLPRGLIRYDSERHLANPQELRRFRFLRPRTVWYALIIGVVGGLMLYGLMNREKLELNVLHDRNPLFVKLSDGTVRNGYTIKILNKTHEDRHFSLAVAGLADAVVTVEGAGDLTPDDLKVFADSVGHFRVYVAGPKPSEVRKAIVFSIRDKQEPMVADTETLFMSGP